MSDYSRDSVSYGGKSKKKRKPGKRSKLRVLVGTLIVLVGLVVVGCVGVAAACLHDLPDYKNIDLYAKSGYSTLYASDGTTEIGRVTLENRIEVGMNNVSPYVLNGAVDTEDVRFYRHHGVDPIGIARALINNLRGGNREGASTITQQLVRNTVLLDEMNEISIKRKVREMYIAWQVENNFTKDQILMMYLNVINFGSNCYGIEAAAEGYFNCSAKDLTLAQAAMLVGIPQAPTANNPRENYDNSLNRSHTVLARMLSAGDITQTEYDEAMANPPQLAEEGTSAFTTTGLAPHFTDYVKQLLHNNDEFNISALSQGGLSIFTTIDADCQEAAVDAIEQGLQYQDQELDASLVSIDPDTGYITALTGGRDYDANEYSLATQMSRQAGSSFKTFALIAAIEAGINPEITISGDEPAIIDQGGGAPWTVYNCEGEGSQGNVTLAQATAESLNVVYARLTHELGGDKVVDAAHRCGIQSELNPYDSICLGTSGVNTLEMAVAYATIASGGVYHEPVAVLRIDDARGDTVYEYEPQEGTQVITPAVAQRVTEILEGVVNYGTGTSARLGNGQVAAGKTGTSEDMRDLWFCGFTPQLSTAVWVGYRQEANTHSYGGSIPAPIWRIYMTRALEGKPTEVFPSTSETLTWVNSWYFEQSTEEEEEEEEEEQPEGGDTPEDPVDPEPSPDPEPPTI